MKKYLIFFFFILSCLIASGCTKKILYLTPEITGYIYDSKTHKPLSNQSGDMGFNGRTDSDNAKVNLKSDGSFTIPAVTATYYFIKPDVKQYTNFPSEIFVSFKNYQPKIIDYSEAYNQQVPEDMSSFSHYKKINLGKIYLDHE
ncbi:hypothetical protein [Acinetobacter baumannii]|uniref:hypothetical protein n=1 Tax=Acinetobacter baumannii TaxID=470 RepID=UPI0023408D8A|nr:hypothetical protein [Acinetobacter baumannii]MDC5317595.1 hypothetical protein [Acinetobacter baumannii]MDK2170234.1 hypothetical protein [Acinetobacter baumannii]MDK2181055.1 hypothetical protein [Acinetobacter baumannii]MDK2327166.1 hypothetical protein [Acinetobacter baumannii]MDV7565091.1 hypothetical protein [Acinetobacter baumannii]